jgi:hypothetical protein
MRYIGGAPLEPPLVDDPDIIIFLSNGLHRPLLVYGGTCQVIIGQFGDRTRRS